MNYLDRRFGPHIGARLRHLLDHNDTVMLVGSTALQIVLGELWEDEPVTIACSPAMVLDVIEALGTVYRVANNTDYVPSSGTALYDIFKTAVASEDLPDVHIMQTTRLSTTVETVARRGRTSCGTVTRTCLS